MNHLDSKDNPRIAKTTVTVPENIFYAIRNYMILNNIQSSDQGKVVEEALIELFKNSGVPVDSDQGEFVFSIKGKKIKKMKF